MATYYSYEERTYIGNGLIWLAEFNSEAPMIHIGDCTKLTLGIKTNSIKTPQNMTGGGGNLNNTTRISEATVSITAKEVQSQTLALALWGHAMKGVGGTVTGDPVTLLRGGLNRVGRTGMSNVQITDNQGVLVDAASYEVRSGGIYLPPSADPSTDTPIVATMAYKYPPMDTIEALTNTGKEYHLLFEGLNEAKSGKPFVVDVWRTSFAPTTGLDLITDKATELPLVGEALVDFSKPPGESRYFRAEQVM
ncbi:phage tail tube protein [Endothiovibrio diazotrophicus]